MKRLIFLFPESPPDAVKDRHVYGGLLVKCGISYDLNIKK